MNKSTLVRVEHDAEIAFIIINNPPVNTITAGVRDGLRLALKQLNRERAKAVIMMCEGSTFFSGADIGEFNGPPREAEYREIFTAFEKLDVPVVAVMHGTVMGGGLEIALASHYRIAEVGTRFSMPEVTLGIIPGAGGTQRMPRLIGAEKALDLIVSARMVDAGQARELGFIDEVIDGELRQAALMYVRRLLATGAGPRRTREMRVEPVTATAEIFERATQQAHKLYPNRTAALVAIEVIRTGLAQSFEQGLDYETRRVNECKATVESRGAVHAFFAERQTRHVPEIADPTVSRKIASAGVIGAGTMGGGIAICFANAGIPVTLIDANEQGLQRGLANIDRTFQSMVDRGRITADVKAQRLQLISSALSYEALSNADIIIEAVFEDMALKQKIFSQLDAIAKPGAILATNTSTLDIERIATATKCPEDVIGTHFFSPANVMPLLEVVRTTHTSADVIKTVMELSKPLRKTPVLARVCYGFIGNRMMEGYAREAQRMVLEGATPRQVDSVLEGWGMAMGILAVFDMAGIDVGVNVHKANAAQYPPDPTYYQADLTLYEAGRFGQKNGKGYYRYESGSRVRIDDPEALAILKARAASLGIAPHDHDNQEIVERCLYPLLNEGFRILEEGIVIRASDIDVVWTSGYGFPRYRGGPMFYAETIGLKTLLDGILKYQKLFGAMHWQPAALLVELVQKGISISDWERARQSK